VSFPTTEYTMIWRWQNFWDAEADDDNNNYDDDDNDDDHHSSLPKPVVKYSSKYILGGDKV